MDTYLTKGYITYYIEFYIGDIMAKSSEYDERRTHQRLPVSSGVIAVLITSSPEIIGSVSDISLGGAKITYHDPTNRNIRLSKLKVDFISDNRFVEAIPCSNTWDRAIEANDFFETEDLRQCGIQFSGLTPNQLFLLRGFINRCAIPKHAHQPSPDFPCTSNQ
jgi:hypothetical protein